MAPRRHWFLNRNTDKHRLYQEARESARGLTYPHREQTQTEEDGKTLKATPVLRQNIGTRAGSVPTVPRHMQTARHTTYNMTDTCTDGM